MGDSPASTPSLALILGPILLGSLFNWCLLGALGVQTYLYFHWFPQDRHVIKWLVATLFILDIAQTAVSTYLTWEMLVSGWGDVATFSLSPWCLCVAVMLSALIASIVQIFFAQRVWKLSKSIIVSLTIVAVSLVQCVSAVTGSLQVWVANADNSKVLRTFVAFALWLSGSLTCDVIIAASMVYYLIRAKPTNSFQSADSLIYRLINFSIQTGTVTTVCAGIDLILFLKFQTNNLHDVPFLMLGKLYSNTLLANLNARESLFGNQKTSRRTTDRSGTVLTDPVGFGMWIENTMQDSRYGGQLESAREMVSFETNGSTRNAIKDPYHTTHAL